MIGLLVLASCQQSANKNVGGSVDQKVDSLLSIMTIEEKIGQLNLPSAGEITTGQASNSDIAGKIKSGLVGGLFNIRTAEKIREVQRVAVEESRLGIPLIFGMDVIHGYKTVFPIPLGLSCSWDMDLIQQTARVAANEATADGIAWTFSPMVDISRDPRWGRMAEGAGEDPYLGSRIAEAMVRGYQGEDLTANNTLLSCVKHFALYGAPDAGRDYNTVDMSHQRMYNFYFPPYQAAIDAGVGSVMASFNVVDNIPATGNQWLLTEVLRNQWSFDGFVVSDYTGVTEMIEHGLGDTLQVSALALKAGNDMDMVSEGFLNTLKKSLEAGIISEADIDLAAGRILKAKFELGLFDAPYQYCDPERAKTEVYTAENRDFARKAAAESFVLLKNEEQLLPLKKQGTIALIGPLADNKWNMAGTWSVAGDYDKSISVRQGLEEAVSGKAKVLYARGSNVVEDAALESRISIFGKPTNRDSRSEEEMIREAVQIARKSDVIVAAMGESAELSGECSSVTDIQIPANQRRLIEALLETGKPLVMLVFNGRPMALKWEQENVPAILDVWFGGSEAGYAIADVLFGDVNPSGKLSATFPQNVGQVPIYYNHFRTGRPIQTEWFQKFKTNYLDVSNDPVYPFGYGLSYASFEYGDLTLTSTSLKGDTDQLKIKVPVTNTSTVDGKEVVQLYIRDLVGTVTRPVKELKAFEKVMIPAGETVEVEFEITTEDLKFYKTDLSKDMRAPVYDWEPGEFEIMVGSNSRDVQVESVEWGK